VNSCYDWSALLAHRFDADAAPLAEWPAAKIHLGGCDDCRKAASAVDPTLAFHDAAQWIPEQPEIEAMRQAVATLRRSGQLSAEVAAARQGGRTLAPQRFGSRRRIVSAALFALALALLPGRTAVNGVNGVDGMIAANSVDRIEPRFEISATPASAIEGLDRPQARVYEWGADDLSVVMVVDESLDV